MYTFILVTVHYLRGCGQERVLYHQTTENKNWKIVSDYLFSRDDCKKVKSRACSNLHNKQKHMSSPCERNISLITSFSSFLAFMFQHVDRDFLNIS